MHIQSDQSAPSRFADGRATVVNSELRENPRPLFRNMKSGDLDNSIVAKPSYRNHFARAEILHAHDRYLQVSIGKTYGWRIQILGWNDDQKRTKKQLRWLFCHLVILPVALHFDHRLSILLLSFEDRYLGRHDGPTGSW